MCVHEKLACTQKALDSAREENRLLVQSVEHSVLTNSSLRRKLQRAREQHQASVTLRYAVSGAPTVEHTPVFNGVLVTCGCVSQR